MSEYLQAGIHQIGAADYHRDLCETPSLSASVAKLIVEKSSLHAWFSHPRLNPKYKPEESDTFDYGTAAHAMLLEGKKDGLVVVDADDWRKKEARAARDEARAAGKTAILARQLAKVEAMVGVAQAAVYESELKGLFETGKPEQTLIWRDGKSWCRSRLDWLLDNHKVILDYKTTGNAEPGAFCRQVWSMGYDVQAAFYLRGLAALGHRSALFVFLAQETEPPFACSLVSLDPQSMAIAERKVDYALQLWAGCMASGKWAGYPKRIAYADAPAWQASRWLESEAA